MGRTRGAVAATSQPTAPAASGGWEFRGAARGQDDAENYSYTLIEGVDPDVWDLCMEYEIEDRRMHKLHAIMMSRIDTFESDMLKLWDSVKNARDPVAIIGAKMRDMEKGTFIGKAPKRYYSEKPLKDFFKKYSIDNLCKDSLADALYDRRLRIIRERKIRGGGKDGDGFPEKDMRNVLDKLDREIEGSRNPSALVMKQIPAIEFCTGRWQGVGQIEEAKKAPIESEKEIVSKEDLRAEDDRIAEMEGRVKRPKIKHDAPPSNRVPKDTGTPAPNALDMNLGAVAQPFPFTIDLPKETKKKQANVPAFDSDELAKRLSNLPEPDENDAPSPEAIPEPMQAPASPPASSPPLAAPPPEPPKRNLLPVKLSQKSVELVTKSGDGAADAPTDKATAKKTVVKKSQKSAPKSAKQDSGNGVADMSDLEIASKALGKSIEELKKVPKDELRSMIFAKMNAPSPSASSSRSPSPSQEEEEEVKQMSDLEMASIALRRPIEELKKIPQEELRAMVLAKMSGGSAENSGSDSLSPARSSCSRSGRGARHRKEETSSKRSRARSDSRHQTSVKRLASREGQRGQLSRSPQQKQRTRDQDRSRGHDQSRRRSTSRSPSRTARNRDRATLRRRT